MFLLALERHSVVCTAFEPSCVVLVALCRISVILDSSRRQTVIGGASPLESVCTASRLTNVVGSRGWLERTWLRVVVHVVQ